MVSPFFLFVMSAQTVSPASLAREKRSASSRFPKWGETKMLAKERMSPPFRAASSTSFGKNFRRALSGQVIKLRSPFWSTRTMFVPVGMAAFRRI